MGVTRAVGAAAVAVVLLTSACGAADTPAAGRATPTADPDAGTTVVPVLDPAYAVDEPGPRTGPLVPDDILVQDTDPLGDEVVDAIGALKGVQSWARMSLGQVVLENKTYTIAAVDPADYRLFTDRESAELQEEWDRVARGELAVDDDVEKKLPIDKRGYLEVGIDATTSRRVHVGAVAPQVEGVDLVVNEKVGEALGMTMGNALVISTGQASPQSLKKPIGAIIGQEISVQNLDVVAQLGLDPDAYQTAVLVGSFADAVGVFNYTPTGGGRIAPDPRWVSSHITTQVVPILGSVTCNKYIFPQLKAALQEVQTGGLADAIHPGEYAGCYYPRFIAGTTTLSNHSFGLALDLNTPGNQRGTVGEMDRGVVAIFKKWGFAWGGDWRYTDPMHFELSQLTRPGS